MILLVRELTSDSEPFEIHVETQEQADLIRNSLLYEVLDEYFV